MVANELFQSTCTASFLRKKGKMSKKDIFGSPFSLQTFSKKGIKNEIRKAKKAGCFGKCGHRNDCFQCPIMIHCDDAKVKNDDKQGI
jgi:hypothetical protein